MALTCALPLAAKAQGLRIDELPLKTQAAEDPLPLTDAHTVPLLAPTPNGLSWIDSTVDHTPKGIYLSARLALGMPEPVLGVLEKGIPLHFVWTGRVMQRRWYWTDKTLAERSRTYRLAYQPLSARWRLSLVNVDAAETGLRSHLQQNFDRLSDAVAAMTRQTDWWLGPSVKGVPLDDTDVTWGFRLDLTQLPKPLQIGLANSDAWRIEWTQIQRIPPATEGGS